jgi:hypothetical protein
LKRRLLRCPGTSSKSSGAQNEHGVVAGDGGLDLGRRTDAREPALDLRGHGQRRRCGAAIPRTSTPEEFAAVIKSDSALWGEIIGRLNIKLD